MSVLSPGNPPHYSGNFWWFNASYMTTRLDVSRLKDKFDPEFFIIGKRQYCTDYYSILDLYSMYESVHKKETYGPLIENRPEYSIRQLFTEFYGNEEPSLYHSSFFERRVGGHLVDYAEHLLDITHAPYTHGVELEVVDNSLVLKPHSFMVEFAIKNTSFRPKFTYITPTFGFVDYGFTMKTFIIFIVEDVGQIRMIQLPIVSGLFNNVTGSIFAALYTHFDFTEEAAFFSTKSHLNRCLTKNESSMLQFREWFKETYYTADERKRFREKQEFLKTITSW